MSNTQTVRPAGAGHETLWVALSAACVIAVAAVVVGVRAQPEAAPVAAAHQVDARSGLNAAEQGVHADLLVAAEEIAALQDADGGAVPTVERLSGLGLPPFSAGPETQARGGHEWRLLPAGEAAAYIGRSAAPTLAGSMLLRVPTRTAASTAHAHGHGVEVWVQREGAAAWPAAVDDAALIRQGWREVVTRYDAGVTRSAH